MKFSQRLLQIKRNESFNQIYNGVGSTWVLLNIGIVNCVHTIISTFCEFTNHSFFSWAWVSSYSYQECYVNKIIYSKVMECKLDMNFKMCCRQTFMIRTKVNYAHPQRVFWLTSYVCKTYITLSLFIILSCIKPMTTTINSKNKV